MNADRVKYNERSWAIDVISEINAFVSKIDKPIKRAGGESTIITTSKRLFPDVLLFGESGKGKILQGWELKMPETPITDSRFIKNAREKAQCLGLNSFLLWNVSAAVLYIEDEDGEFVPYKRWDSLYLIKTRDQVEAARIEWKKTLHRILFDLNEFFENGILKSKTYLDSFSETGILEIILQNTTSLARQLQTKAAEDGYFSASVDEWWMASNQEYIAENDQWLVLSRIILINWIHKFIFAHVLKKYYTIAGKIEEIDGSKIPTDAINIFREISEKCDFFNIFGLKTGEEYLTTDVWSELVELNAFLRDLQFERVDQYLLQKILQTTVYAGKRKIVGQYTTPVGLAHLLVRMTVMNKKKTVYDPCCGTGTIGRAIYDIKKEYGITHGDSLKTILASDKFAFPLQIATLALTDPANIGKVVRVFKRDVIDISVGDKIEFVNPDNGESITEEFKPVEYITSNLPFVQQEDLARLNANIYRINDKIKQMTGNSLSLSGKSDLYAYLPFYLWHLLSDSGKMGIITSNAWLGTDWGKNFRTLLQRFFDIEYVVISGKGRWFPESKAVTTILVLNKIPEARIIRPSQSTSSGPISFITVYEKGIDTEKARSTANTILTKKNSDNVNIKSYSPDEMESLGNLGIGWNAMFVELDWLFSLKEKLIPTRHLFKINRGERRGWDKMFYPERGHGIEPKYIKPVLKSPQEIDSLVARPDSEAFCCSTSLEDLEKKGDSGALFWIKKFEIQVNTRGKPLPEALAKPQKLWYEMDDSTLADLVANINYGNRLFIARMQKRSFVNQRLTRFTATTDDLDIDLCHALLNSLIGIFYLEACGFGRGLGALDLSSSKLKKNLFILNPDILTPVVIEQIKQKFKNLLKREILPLSQELAKEDRGEFDDAVLKAYGVFHLKDRIKQALLGLYRIRKSVRDSDNL